MRVFQKNYYEKQECLRNRLRSAQSQLNQVRIKSNLRICISKLCSELSVDGLRGDIVINRASRALAAFDGRKDVSSTDVKRVAPICLRHRLRKDPLEIIDSGKKVRETLLQILDS